MTWLVALCREREIDRLLRQVMSHSGAVGSAPNCNFAPMVHPWFSTVHLVFDELCADYYPSTSHESHVFLETRQAFAETLVHVTLHEWLEDVSDCEITDVYVV